MIYYLVSLFAIIMGIGVAFSLSYISKFADYMSKRVKQIDSIYIKTFDLLWRISLPFLGGIIFIFIPLKIFTLLINDMEVLDNSFIIYLFSLIASCLTFSIFLARTKNNLKLKYR